MATVNKDFKVKNGLQVAGDASFGGTVTVAAPTLANHAVTKAYADALSGGATVSATEPVSPSDGDLWFNTETNHLAIYAESQWYVLALYGEVPDHTHDTSIGGSGQLVDTFVDGGTPATTLYVFTADAGTSDTTDWNTTYSGGVL
jgi:hypothetical protein